jgi:hypothetical protein
MSQPLEQFFALKGAIPLNVVKVWRHHHFARAEELVNNDFELLSTALRRRYLQSASNTEAFLFSLRLKKKGVLADI